MSRKPFVRPFPAEGGVVRWVRRAALLLLAVHLPIWALSSYRAYVQVRALELRVPGPVLRAGSEVGADAVTSGRTLVDVRLELLQGARRETLAVHREPGNGDAVYDPRTRRASLRVVLTPELLRRFRPGPARLRATAVGRKQWLRLPPPTVREAAVEIRDAGAEVR